MPDKKKKNETSASKTLASFGRETLTFASAAIRHYVVRVAQNMWRGWLLIIGYYWCLLIHTHILTVDKFTWPKSEASIHPFLTFGMHAHITYWHKFECERAFTQDYWNHYKGFILILTRSWNILATRDKFVKSNFKTRLLLSFIMELNIIVFHDLGCLPSTIMEP